MPSFGLNECWKWPRDKYSKIKIVIFYKNACLLAKANYADIDGEYFLDDFQLSKSIWTCPHQKMCKFPEKLKEIIWTLTSPKSQYVLLECHSKIFGITNIFITNILFFQIWNRFHFYKCEMFKRLKEMRWMRDKNLCKISRCEYCCFNFSSVCFLCWSKNEPACCVRIWWFFQVSYIFH